MFCFHLKEEAPLALGPLNSSSLACFPHNLDRRGFIKVNHTFYGADTHSFNFIFGAFPASFKPHFYMINKNNSTGEFLLQVTFRPCRLQNDFLSAGPSASGSVQTLVITHFDSFNVRMSLRMLFIILCTEGMLMGQGKTTLISKCTPSERSCFTTGSSSMNRLRQDEMGLQPRSQLPPTVQYAIFLRKLPVVMMKPSSYSCLCLLQ